MSCSLTHMTVSIRANRDTGRTESSQAETENKDQELGGLSSIRAVRDECANEPDDGERSVRISCRGKRRRTRAEIRVQQEHDDEQYDCEENHRDDHRGHSVA